MVNRIWFHLFGRGIVDPLDDFRATNLPINNDLLEALTVDFHKSGFSIKNLIRVITSSATYQRSSPPLNSPDDFGNFAYFKSRLLQAEETRLRGVFQASEAAAGAPATASKPSAAPKPTATAPATKVVSMADIDATVAASGKTKQEVIDAIKAKGYTVK
jgi:hypothetical protein